MKCDNDNCTNEMEKVNFHLSVHDIDFELAYFGNFCSRKCGTDQISNIWDHLGEDGKNLKDFKLPYLDNLEFQETTPNVMQPDHMSWPDEIVAPPTSENDEVINEVQNYLDELCEHLKSNIPNTLGSVEIGIFGYQDEEFDVCDWDMEFNIDDVNFSTIGFVNLSPTGTLGIRFEFIDSEDYNCFIPTKDVDIAYAKLAMVKHITSLAKLIKSKEPDAEISVAPTTNNATVANNPNDDDGDPF